MAYYNHGAAMRKKMCADKYDELKKYIISKDENGKLKEWFLAHEHIIDLENQLEQYKKQIKEYQDFFSLMNKLLPKNPSPYNIIN